MERLRKAREERKKAKAEVNEARLDDEGWVEYSDQDLEDKGLKEWVIVDKVIGEEERRRGTGLDDKRDGE